MFRITKLTDYALVLLNEMDDKTPLSARTLNLKTQVPLATTNKILKSLVTHQICSSKGGKSGGFYLSYPKNEISLLQIIQAIEGHDKKFTDCNLVKDGKDCSLKHNCKISHKMSQIDKEIHQLLSSKLLSELA